MITDTDLAPFDPDFDADNPYITDVPERFVSHEDTDLTHEELAKALAWGEWFELTFNSEGN